MIPRLLIAIQLLAAVPLVAHDIPRDVTVQLLLKPDGQRLHLLARVPLSAMRDIAFPQRDGGLLDIARADAVLADAAQLWLAGALDVEEDGRKLPKPSVHAVRVALESDRSFASFEDATAHFAAPKLPDSVAVAWNQVLLDVWFEYPINNANSPFALDPKLARLGQRVLTVVRWIPRPGVVRALEFTGDPGLVRLDPSWSQAARRFVVLGFEHILTGYDHLLFLLCLVIPFRRFLALVPVVTAFTVAHSITLIASAYDMAPGALWFPPLIEVLIAASIVYMALENIVRPGKDHHRWMIAFGFGLIHGFGFSFALRETLQFAGGHLLASLVSFNLGVEAGQLLALLVAIPVLDFLFRYVTRNERMGTIIVSAFVAHTAWHWLTERSATLGQFQWTLPQFDAAFWALTLRWMAIMLAAVAGMRWLLRQWSARSRAPRCADPDGEAPVPSADSAT